MNKVLLLPLNSEYPDEKLNFRNSCVKMSNLRFRNIRRVFRPGPLARSFGSKNWRRGFRGELTLKKAFLWALKLRLSAALTLSEASPTYSLWGLVEELQFVKTEDFKIFAWQLVLILVAACTQREISRIKQIFWFHESRRCIEFIWNDRKFWKIHFSHNFF